MRDSSFDNGQLYVSVRRPVFNQFEFDETYCISNRDGDESRSSLTNKIKSTFGCSVDRCKSTIFNFLPILIWLPNYTWKQDLFADIVAGLTVGIMNIPQGMAYGMLCGLKPIYGLYTSFFPPLIYALFGTSHHVSVGTFAIISLMVRTSIHTAKTTWDTDYSNCTTLDDVISSSTDDCVSDIEIATALSLLVGIYMIIFGVLHVGFISSYLSDQLVQGLTTGAAFHVLTSQLGALLGLSQMPNTDSLWGLSNYYYTLFAHRIGESNPAVCIGSVICIVILVVYKECFNAWIKKKLKFPFPIELLLVVFATVISHFAKINDIYHVPIVQHIPTGLPAPSVPPVKIFHHLVYDAFMIAVMVFSLSVSMEKLFAKKHDYQIRPNQEWFAFGITSLFSSFFSCHCSCASLSRSAVQDVQGGRSQLASFVGASVILFVLLFIAQLFECLPKCVLASIIVVALKGMFVQAKELKPLWKHSKIDFFIWLVTFSGVLIANVTYGLLVGVVFAVLSVIARSQWPDATLLGHIDDTDIYKEMETYQTSKEIAGIKIFRFDAPLYFANVENFKTQLYSVTGINPYVRKLALQKEKLRLEKEAAKQKDCDGSYQNDMDCIASDGPNKSKSADCQTSHNQPTAPFHDISSNSTSINCVVSPEDELHHIIVDCSAFPYVDVMGVNCLKQIYEEYRDLEQPISVFFATCKVAIRHRFECCDFYDTVPKKNLFLSVHDAVLTAIRNGPQVRLRFD